MTGKIQLITAAKAFLGLVALGLILGGISMAFQPRVSSIQYSQDNTKLEGGTCIFVAKLNFQTEDADLRDAFEAFGEVTSAKVMKDGSTKRSRGFGFVTMPNEDEALTAIDSLNETELEGRIIVVKQCEEATGSGPRPRHVSPGGGGGYGGAPRRPTPKPSSY